MTECEQSTNSMETLFLVDFVTEQFTFYKRQQIPNTWEKK